jgi:hypothetical protein
VGFSSGTHFAVPDIGEGIGPAPFPARSAAVTGKIDVRGLVSDEA